MIDLNRLQGRLSQTDLFDDSDVSDLMNVGEARWLLNVAKAAKRHKEAPSRETIVTLYRLLEEAE